MKRERLTEPLVVPVWNQTIPNEEILFGSRPAFFENSRGEDVRSSVQGSLRFTGRPELRLRIDEPSGLGRDALDLAFGGEERLRPMRFEDAREPFNVFVTKWSTRGSTELCPDRSGVTAKNTDERICRLVFHIFNGPELRGDQDYIYEFQRGARGRPRVTLEADGWRVVITDIEEQSKRCKSLKENGGYLLTHVGVVEHDGGAFKVDDGKDFIGHVATFLSLAFGRWSGLSLLAGFDKCGKLTFEEWGTRFTSPNASPLGDRWFCTERSEMLGEVFPGYLRLAMSEVWESQLRMLTWWYLAANQRGPAVDPSMAVVLAQTGLELAAWNHCVISKKMVSRAAFKQSGGLRASDKLRLLASSLGLPLEIPDELEGELRSPGLQLEDTPHAITELRNQTVHPDKTGKIPSESWYAGWKLTMWYLDLVILSLCDYRGTYFNRLTGGLVSDVEPVPWVSSTNP